MKDVKLEKMGVRKLDELGRIVVPAELRKNMGIKEGDTLEFFMDDSGNIVIKRYVNVCSFCEARENLIKFREKLICKSCIEQLSGVSCED